MINFRARYISPASIIEINRKNQSKKEIAFVELNPRNDKDRLRTLEATILWDNEGGKGFGYDICQSMSDIWQKKYIGRPQRFFALTTQKKDFHDLIPENILALAQVKTKNSNTRHLEYLQVDPLNSNKEKTARFKHVGTAMLNSLKKLYHDKKITLDSVQSAVKFYLKNGFKLEKAWLIEPLMSWKAPKKTLL